jgi:Pro-kumamolisin, activation domain/IPT/TIG domain/Fibronectin type III domain
VSTPPTSSRRTPRRLVVTATSLLIGGMVGAPALAAPASAASPTPASAGSTGMTRLAAAPKLPTTATRLGGPSSTAKVSGDVALQPRDPAGVTAAAVAVSNPKSPQYRHYLAPGAFRAQYGPTATTIATVEATLRAAHLTVSSVSRNGMLIHFTGTAAQAGAALHTGFATYRLKNGRTGTEMTSAPAFPTSIASQVTGVIGLNTLAKPVSTIEHWDSSHAKLSTPVSRAAAAAPIPGAPVPCAAASKNALHENGLTYDHLAHAYGLDGLFRSGDFGAGQHIAVYELAPFVASDVKTFETCYFGKAGAAAMATRLHSILVDGGAGTGVGPGTDEADLDVQDVAAFAPKADIDVYTAPITNLGYLDEYNQIISSDTDKFITSSWGSTACEQDTESFEPGLVDTENQLFEQAALQGQTVLNSSGDSGSDECAFNGDPSPAAPFVSAADPASQPFVTSVGGTAVTDDTNRPKEQVWNDGNFGGAGGGGTSALWSAPSWQQAANASVDPSVFAGAFGTGPNFGDGFDQPCPQASPTDMTACRTVPDVTAEADEFTGSVGIFDATFGGWVDFGGTSSSTPLWAAMLADVQASAGCQATGALGFISPKLYAIGANPAQDAASFNDVTVGNNDTYAISNGDLFRATRGFDLASGLGSPRLTAPGGGPALAAFLCAQAPSDAPGISSLTPAVEHATPTGALTIAGTGFITGASAVSIGTFAVPTSDIDVVSDTQIRVTAPPAATQTGGDTGESGAGRAIVSVTTPHGSSPITAASQLQYIDTNAGSAVPTVTLVSNDVGPQAGGNHVLVYGAGFTSGGLPNVTSVTVGGVAATFTITSTNQLSVTVPAYNDGVTVCAPVDAHPTQICQTQLVVTGPNGASAPSTIHPLYEGATDGSTPCAGCASLPAPSEYDYVPAPTITDISTTYVSELGDTVETISGHGFAAPGFDWVTVGDPTNAANEDFSALSVTPDEIDVLVNPTEDFSVASEASSLRVVTSAGTSGPAGIIYAGIPRVDTVSPNAGPVTGGTAITVTGLGFNAVQPSAGGSLEYVDDSIGFPRDQLVGFTVHDGRSLSATTPQTIPGIDSVTACTVTACSFPGNQKQFDRTQFVFFTAGNPVITSVSPHRGPAQGGSSVVIRGHNLSGLVSVTFGHRHASLNFAEQTGSSNPQQITVHAPPGPAGITVPVQVTTQESVHAHGGTPSAITSKTRFHYLASSPSAPRDVKARKVKKSHKLHVSWLKPLENGGSRITGYRVALTTLNLFGKNPKPTFVRLPASARSVVLKHVPAGLLIVKVRALNHRGAGLAGSVGVFPSSKGFFG